MMTHNVDQVRFLEKNKQDGAHYFESLIGQAYQKGILNDSDMERLQHECLNLLASKTNRYNAGESSSIRVEKAQDIMASNLYTIGVALKTYPHPDTAAAALKKCSVTELYQRGRRCITTMLMSVKAIHGRLLKELFETPNVYYSSTLDGGIKGFFQLYDPDYSAHEIHITADYPLFRPIEGLAGIEFIRAYVKTAYYENQFCRCFPPDDVHHLLCGHTADYPECLMNLFEPVLLIAIGSVLLDFREVTLFLSQTEIKQLCALIYGTQHLAQLIGHAAKKLVHHLSGSDGLMQYITDILPDVVSRIELAVREQMLEQLFRTPYFPENAPKLIFDTGSRMENEQYRRILQEIQECRYAVDKLGIIKNHIHSFVDLEDVLLDADLTEEEAKAVFQKLNISELAAFSKRYLSNHDRSGRSREKRLQQSIYDFISALPEKQQEMIEKLSEAIVEK